MGGAKTQNESVLELLPERLPVHSYTRASTVSGDALKLHLYLMLYSCTNPWFYLNWKRYRGSNEDSFEFDDIVNLQLN